MEGYSLYFIFLIVLSFFVAYSVCKVLQFLGVRLLFNWYIRYPLVVLLTFAFWKLLIDVLDSINFLFLIFLVVVLFFLSLFLKVVVFIKNESDKEND